MLNAQAERERIAYLKKEPPCDSLLYPATSTAHLAMGSIFAPSQDGGYAAIM
jgi:hypothetical protein